MKKLLVNYLVGNILMFGIYLIPVTICLSILWFIGSVNLFLLFLVAFGNIWWFLCFVGRLGYFDLYLIETFGDDVRIYLNKFHWFRLYFYLVALITSSIIILNFS